MYRTIKFELHHLKQYIKVNKISNLWSRTMSSNVVSMIESYCTYVAAFPLILLAFQSHFNLTFYKAMKYLDIIDKDELIFPPSVLLTFVLICTCCTIVIFQKTKRDSLQPSCFEMLEDYS